MPLPLADKAAGEELKCRLWDEYQVEAPMVSWQDHQLIRISIQAYNSPADVDLLVEALSALL